MDFTEPAGPADGGHGLALRGGGVRQRVELRLVVKGAVSHLGGMCYVGLFRALRLQRIGRNRLSAESMAGR